MYSIKRRLDGVSRVLDGVWGHRARKPRLAACNILASTRPGSPESAEGVISSGVRVCSIVDDLKGLLTSRS